MAPAKQWDKILPKPTRELDLTLSSPSAPSRAAIAANRKALDSVKTEPDGDAESDKDAEQVKEENKETLLDSTNNSSSAHDNAQAWSSSASQYVPPGQHSPAGPPETLGPVVIESRGRFDASSDVAGRLFRGEGEFASPVNEMKGSKTLTQSTHCWL